MEVLKLCKCDISCQTLIPDLEVLLGPGPWGSIQDDNFWHRDDGGFYLENLSYDDVGSEGETILIAVSPGRTKKSKEDDITT